MNPFDIAYADNGDSDKAVGLKTSPLARFGDEPETISEVQTPTQPNPFNVIELQEASRFVKTPEDKIRFERYASSKLSPTLPVTSIAGDVAKSAFAPFAASGRALVAIPADLGAAAGGDYSYKNLEAVPDLEKPLPYEEELAKTKGVGAGVQQGAVGLIKLIPMLAGLEATGGLGIPSVIAAPTIFGGTTAAEGGDTQQVALSAALGLAFPAVDAVAGRFAGNLTKKWLLDKAITEGQAKAIEIAVKQAAMQATMQALAIPEYEKHPKDWAKILVSNGIQGLAFGAMDAARTLAPGAKSLGKQLNDAELKRYTTDLASELGDYIKGKKKFQTTGEPNGIKTVSNKGSLPIQSEGTAEVGKENEAVRGPDSPESPAGEQEVKVAPVKFEGLQDDGSGNMVQQWTATEAVPGLEKNSTYRPETILAAGYTLPEIPKDWIVFNSVTGKWVVFDGMNNELGSAQYPQGAMEIADKSLSKTPPTAESKQSPKPSPEIQEAVTTGSGANAATSPELPAQPESVAVEKVRVGNNPQLHTVVERLPQSEAEKANDEQPVRVRNDKTGDTFIATESDLTPVKERASAEKPKRITAQGLDRQLASVGLDPSVFPDSASKRKALKRQGAKLKTTTKREPNEQQRGGRDLLQPVSRQEGEAAPNLGEGLPEGRGMSTEEAGAAVAGEFTGGFGVEFVSKVQAEGITGKPEARGYGGFFWKGKVYLVHENMARGDIASAKALLREEVGHGLLRTEEGLKQLRAALDAGKLQLTEAEKKALRDMGYGEANLLDEFIAKSAREGLPWWKSAVEQVRGWLSKFGLANLTNEEVARLLLKSIRGANEFSSAAKVGELLPELAPSPAAPREEGFEAPEDTVQIAGRDYNIVSKERLTPTQKAAGDAQAQDYLGKELKLPGTPDLTYGKEAGSTDRNTVFMIVPDGFNHDAEGQRLTQHLIDEITKQNSPGGNPAYVSSLINAINKNFNLGRFNSVFSEPVLERLMDVSAGESSWRGSMLRAITGIRDDINAVAQNANLRLRRIYSDSFGGSQVRKVMDRLLTVFRDYFNDAEIKNALADRPDMEAFYNTLMIAAGQERGSKLYRKIQAALKPKKPLTPGQKESNALTDEAAAKILQEYEAARNTIPKSLKNQKLTALEILRLTTTPESIAKIEAAMERAYFDAERNAGMDAMRQTIPTEADLDRKQAIQDELDVILSNRDAVPDAEFIARGLAMPKYAHWVKVRDVLGYSPVSMKLVEDLIASDFKGAKFKPKKEAVADVRINLNDLAKSPETEVKHVLDAYRSNLEANMTGATPEARQRVANMVQIRIAEQIAKARQRILDNYFRPEDAAALKTASMRLKELLNAGVSRDPRFQTDKVRQLIRRVAGEYIKDTDFDVLATSTRAEKQQWLETKADEIAGRENFNALDTNTRDYMDAVVRTYLAERIQAGEERITRQFLKGADVSYEAKPVDPDARKKSLEAAKSKLEGLIRAGAIDVSMIEQLAGKSVIAKFVPSMGDLIKQVFATPIYRQQDLGAKFGQLLVSELGIDQAQADKAAEVFNQAFAKKFKAAREKAQQSALDTLTPEERKIVGPTTPLWKKITNLVNSGGFDSGEVMAKTAKEKGWTVPNEAELAQMREWSVHEQSLREPTQRQIDKFGGDVAKAIAEAETATEQERIALIKKMQVNWSRWSMPIGFRNMFSSQIARNNAKAINEVVAANLLLKLGFAVRQMLDVGIVSMPLNAINRSLVHVIERATNTGGFSADTIKDLDAAAKEMAVSRLGSVKATIRSMERTATGHTNRKVLDRMTHSIGAFERMLAKADTLEAKGNLAGARALRLATILRAGYRIAETWDAVQAVGLEWQEMRQQLSTDLRKAGKSRAEIATQLDEIFGGIRVDMLAALEEANAIGLERGIEKDKATLEQDAWNLIKAKAYDRMREATGEATDYQAENEMYRELHSWNLPETGGPGGWIAKGIKAIKTATEESGVPTGGLFSFGNAMGIAVNRMATFSGGGLFGGFGFGDSPWYKGERNIHQRRIEAIQGLSAIGILIALAAFGKILVQAKYPEDKDEKEQFIAEGHKINTVRFVSDDGSWKEYPIQMSPFSFIASPLYMIGGMQQLLIKQNREQERLNAEAAKTGSIPGKAKSIGASDVMGVLAQGMYGMLTGGRTASGAVQSFSDYGDFNLNKTTSRLVTPYVPGLPAWQEAARVMGAAMDTRTATMLELLVPSPWSPHQRVNSLGDSLVNPNAVQRVVQVMTGGIGWGSPDDLKDNHAYQQLFAANYSTPDAGRNKGYDFNGGIRPMTGQELEAYTVARGKAFKQELQSIDVTALPEAEAHKVVQQAFQRANATALQSIGVQPTVSRSATPRASTISLPSTSRRTSFGRVRSSLSRGGRVRSSFRFKTPRLRRTTSRVRPYRMGRVRQRLTRSRRRRVSYLV